MDNIFLTSLTLPEVRQVLRQELEKYFNSSKVVIVTKEQPGQNEFEGKELQNSDNQKKEVGNG